MKNGVQRFGKFLSAMIMPNIGALIAFGFLAAFFNGSGWIPHEGFATIFSAILVYLIPILIASTGGKLIGGERGGIVAAGVHESPIPYADVVTTTTHKTLRGPRGGMILCNQEAADKYNFNKAIFPGIQGGPLMHVIAAKAVCLQEALQPEFKEYQENVAKNAQALCKGLQNRGIKIVSGGTDNHLMLVDLTTYGLTGKETEKILDTVNITCNKNTIPNDPKSPFVTSGIRIGTPAVTSRGMNEEDMDQIAEAIAMMIKEGEAKAEEAKAIVKSLTEKYPLK